ncbi:MAG: hypothetical protein AAFQ42_09600, partial [Pseudomonadota bacterium]
MSRADRPSKTPTIKPSMPEGEDNAGGSEAFQQPVLAPGAAFLAGLRATPLTPGIILFAAMIGFGALARDAGFSLTQ